MPGPSTLKLEQQQQQQREQGRYPKEHLKEQANRVMEQFQQYRQQAQGQAQQSVNTVRSWLTNGINQSADSLRYYVNRYPPLAAFLFTMLVLSAVPLACFFTFAAVTTAIFLSIAMIGFGIVEGLCLMAGTGVLITVLGGIGLITSLGFAWVGAVYAAWRGGSAIAGKLMEGGQQLQHKTQEAISQMQQQYRQPGSTSTPSSSGQGIFTSSSPSQQQQPM